MDVERLVSIDEIKEAQERIRPLIKRTPLVLMDNLSELLQCKVYLKLENFQITGGFKLRGNANKLSVLSKDSLKKGVVTASSGNHGLGLSYSARRLGVKATVVVPQKTPGNKVEKLRSYGATVLLEGSHYDEAVRKAKEISTETGALYVPSFDDGDIIAGNGSIGLEIFDDLPETNLYVCPIGGGGGLAGSGLALKSLSPSIRIVGVEAEGAASMLTSLKAGKPVSVQQVKTKAEGIAVSRPGELPYKIVKKIVDEVVTVSDTEMEAALYHLVTCGKLVPEMAGTAAVAALLAKKVIPQEGPVVCLVTGGNIDPQTLASLLQVKN